ncbi:hypothetical protein B1987_26285 [Mycobacterium kansasii]|uniref:ESX-1 secretion-associated protein EspF n=1 Tax=Mycobacterium attenuatum TaxID=2341086 RepID=A0A498Q057_9MYCO|nr:ESX-1 secretion-associated protein [Mycobacterium attenuatum]ORB86695.1 hypothetical protein B1987_26285 [Mycobacterium kansasii]VBA38637.1 ESX-1 secretion-associated protein EspF [Mycobacterium attenuatum]VBA52788.1 ESX-1 secretion-associated protein EspF [Mycobacterium attenuatum]VBA57817.1 ESX-1 secretion-associated protein EspF [Mycobacterium attenuatum]
MGGFLYVAPEFLSVLERIQQNVSADVKSAVDVVDGISQAVSTTHGSFCSLFNQTLAGFETVRGVTGACVQTVDGQLAEKLRKTAHAYLDTDEGAASLLSKFFR